MRTHINSGITIGSELLRVDEELHEATVVERPNRFLVIAEMDGNTIRCHLHDPGRLKELIYPGNKVMVREKHSLKTDYSVVCADDNGEWVLIDSRYHPILARKFLPEEAKAEVSIGRKRLDFQCGEEYIEVKGCTLLSGRTAKFPDAPSVRAAEHIGLLTDLTKQGYTGTVMILVLRRDAQCFVPNGETDPVFASRLMDGIDAGLQVVLLKMHLQGQTVIYDGTIEICGSP